MKLMTGAWRWRDEEKEKGKEEEEEETGCVWCERKLTEEPVDWQQFKAMFLGCQPTRQPTFVFIIIPILFVLTVQPSPPHTHTDGENNVGMRLVGDWTRISSRVKKNSNLEGFLWCSSLTKSLSVLILEYLLTAYSTALQFSGSLPRPEKHAR